MSEVTFLDGRVRLIEGDCREILPTLGKVDAVVTDPPYGIGAGTGIGKVTKEGKRSAHREDGRQRAARASALSMKFAECRVIRSSGRQLPLPFRRASASSCGTRSSPNSSVSRWLSRRGPTSTSPRRYFAGSRCPSTAAPPSIIRHKSRTTSWMCIDQLPAGCDLILDPFMGSGTTGVAAASSAAGLSA